MRLLINLRHLTERDLQLAGELTAEALDLVNLDPLIKQVEPVRYDLNVQKLENSLLVQGALRAEVRCECARCLKPFTLSIDLPEWCQDLPLEGEEAVPVEGDFVDLTPILREDILLALPQHPICESECAGLENQPLHGSQAAPGGESPMTSSPWALLDKLKL